MSLNYEPASISAEALDRLKSLECDMGKVLLAVEPAKEAQGYARLSEQELLDLQKTEQQLGCIVLALDEQST